MAVSILAATVPAGLTENTAPAAWSAVVRLAGPPPAALRLTGADAARFALFYDPATGVAVLRPVAPLDREAWPAGPDPLLRFGLAATDGAGGWTPLNDGWAVRLEGLDDTAPTGLRFVSGGMVREDAPGATVGQVLATDPDTSAARLEYRVAAVDAGRFVIENQTLRLRDGVDLLRAGGTTLPVLIEVSDGSRFATFSVPVVVQDATQLDDVPPASWSLTETDGRTVVAEGGGEDSVLLALGRAPLSTVTVRVTVPGDLVLAGTAGAGQPLLLRFTPADWAAPRRAASRFRPPTTPRWTARAPPR